MRSFLLNPQAVDRRATLASLVLAFSLAAAFYRFGSFALECVAFVATWALIDLPAQWLVHRFGGEPRGDRPGR